MSCHVMCVNGTVCHTILEFANVTADVYVRIAIRSRELAATILPTFSSTLQQTQAKHLCKLSTPAGQEARLVFIVNVEIGFRASGLFQR